MKRTIDLKNEAIYTDLAIDPACDLTSNLEIKKDKGKVVVLVSMFGRETPVELEFSQVQKLD